MARSCKEEYHGHDSTRSTYLYSRARARAQVSSRVQMGKGSSMVQVGFKYGSSRVHMGKGSSRVQVGFKWARVQVGFKWARVQVWFK